MKHRTAFSYYGGKGMLAKRYPKPAHKTIIEPFAGGAAYSLRYPDRDVVLIERDERTIAAWRAIQSPDANYWADKIPTSVQPGDRVSDMGVFPEGVEFIMRCAANVGTGGLNKRMDTVTKFGALRWAHNTVSKITYWHPRIQHWRIILGSYDDAPNVTATWFIDPPYQSDAGRLYKHTSIDYKHLADFCRSRRGQVIVCENRGADWLDGFVPIAPAQGTGAHHVSKNRRCEVMRHRVNETTK